jgi:hypothetical protein
VCIINDELFLVTKAKKYNAPQPPLQQQQQQVMPLPMGNPLANPLAAAVPVQALQLQQSPEQQAMAMAVALAGETGVAAEVGLYIVEEFVCVLIQP